MKHEITSLNTKKSLAEALKRAVLKKPFSKITVSEIINSCGVNRKTFYYHFEDIYALLKWTLEQEAIEVVKQFDLIVEYEEAFMFVMDYIEQNDAFLRNICCSVGRDELKQFFWNDFIEIMRSLINRCLLYTSIYKGSILYHSLNAVKLYEVIGLIVDIFY